MLITNCTVLLTRRFCIVKEKKSMLVGYPSLSTSQFQYTFFSKRPVYLFLLDGHFW